jgi:hypothetical protein
MDWTASNYDCSSWLEGQAGLGFGKDQVTELDNGCVTYYFRKDFHLWQDPINYSEWHLKVRYDDGFVAYINGREVARRNMPVGDINYDTRAVVPYESPGFEDIVVTGYLTDCDDAS